ncbi:MAG: 50S ribosomal protein L21 [Spirochaetales bacterium]|nr:50S ribosomal protein L21 [Spirochaetales bacterium]
MYALVEIQGKQYKAEKGGLLKVDKMLQEDGSKVEFDSILLMNDGDKVKIGTPYVQGAKISTTVQETKKDKKVTIIKFKRRKGYRRKNGHRQSYTYLKVNDITGA